MGRAELREAIGRPAARAGLDVEDGLIDVLVDEVGDEPGALPLLSTTLLELWQARDGHVLRLQDYRATGGVRSGLDAAKAFALGATLVGVARPLLRAAMDGDAALDHWIESFLEELRTVLMLAGCARTAELRVHPRVIHGRTRSWLDQLGYA